MITKHFIPLGAAVLFAGFVPSGADASDLPDMADDRLPVVSMMVSVGPESCVLPDDPNEVIPGCWWEAGWFLAEAGMCAAVAFPPAKAAKVASNVGKALKKLRKGKKKGKDGGERIDWEDVRSIMTAVFGGFICADMWSSFKEWTECMFRN